MDRQSRWSLYWSLGIDKQIEELSLLRAIDYWLVVIICTLKNIYNKFPDVATEICWLHTISSNPTRGHKIYVFHALMWIKTENICKILVATKKLQLMHDLVDCSIFFKWNCLSYSTQWRIYCYCLTLSCCNKKHNL